MKKTLVPVVVVAALLASPALFAQSNDRDAGPVFDDRFVFTGNVGYIHPDDDLNADHSKYYSFRVGRRIKPDTLLEFEISYDELDFPDSDFELNHNTVSINWVQINPEPTWNPYFLLGLGVIDHNAGEINGADPMVQVGVGGMWNLNNEGVMLRAEIRLRYDRNKTEILDSNSVIDGIATVGITVPLSLRSN